MVQWALMQERWNLGEEYWGYAKINSGRRLAIRSTMPRSVSAGRFHC